MSNEAVSRQACMQCVCLHAAVMALVGFVKLIHQEDAELYCDFAVQTDVRTGKLPATSPAQVLHAGPGLKGWSKSAPP